MSKYDFVDRAVEELGQEKAELALSERYVASITAERNKAQEALDAKEAELLDATSGVELARSLVNQRTDFYSARLFNDYATEVSCAVEGSNVMPYAERFFRIHGASSDESKRRAILLGNLATPGSEVVPAIFVHDDTVTALSFYDDGTDGRPAMSVRPSGQDMLRIEPRKKIRQYEYRKDGEWVTPRQVGADVSVFSESGENFVIHDDPEAVDLHNEERYILVGRAAVDFAIDQFDVKDNVQIDVLKELLQKGTDKSPITDPELSLDEYGKKLEKALISQSSLLPIEFHPLVLHNIPGSRAVALQSINKVIREGYIGKTVGSEVNLVSRFDSYEFSSDLIDNLAKETLQKILDEVTVFDDRIMRWAADLDDDARKLLVDDAIKSIEDSSTRPSRRQNKSIKKLKEYRKQVDQRRLLRQGCIVDL